VGSSATSRPSQPPSGRGRRTNAGFRWSQLLVMLGHLILEFVIFEL
jgi:hypothetical protein